MALPTRRKVFPLAGEGQVNHDGTRRQDIILNCQPGDPVALIREPYNQYDANAVLVTVNGKGVGYLSRDDAKLLSPVLDEGRRHRAGIHRLLGGVPEAPSYGVEIAIAWDDAALPQHTPLDARQLQSRRGKVAVLGRQRNADGKFEGKAEGCLPILVLGLVTGMYWLG